jgi:hypothetical protein
MKTLIIVASEPESFNKNGIVETVIAALKKKTTKSLFVICMN